MIQPTSNFNGYNRTDAFSGTSAPKAAGTSKNEPAAPAGGERLSSSNTDALREALNNTPEVRADVVARGKALAVDPNYPPREIIEKLSELMIQAREPAAE
jgi:hypothetical protein